MIGHLTKIKAAITSFPSRGKEKQEPTTRSLSPSSSSTSSFTTSSTSEAPVPETLDETLTGLEKNLSKLKATFHEQKARVTDLLGRYHDHEPHSPSRDAKLGEEIAELEDGLPASFAHLMDQFERAQQLLGGGALPPALPPMPKPVEPARQEEIPRRRKRRFPFVSEQSYYPTPIAYSFVHPSLPDGHQMILSGAFDEPLTLPPSRFDFKMLAASVHNIWHTLTSPPEITPASKKTPVTPCFLEAKTVVLVTEAPLRVVMHMIRQLEALERQAPLAHVSKLAPPSPTLETAQPPLSRHATLRGDEGEMEEEEEVMTASRSYKVGDRPARAVRQPRSSAANGREKSATPVFTNVKLPSVPSQESGLDDLMRHQYNDTLDLSSLRANLQWYRAHAAPLFLLVYSLYDGHDARTGRPHYSAPHERIGMITCAPEVQMHYIQAFQSRQWLSEVVPWPIKSYGYGLTRRSRQYCTFSFDPSQGLNDYADSVEQDPAPCCSFSSPEEPLGCSRTPRLAAPFLAFQTMTSDGRETTTEEEGRFFRCGRCKKALYCSETCQKADWARHARICNMIISEKVQRRLRQATLRRQGLMTQRPIDQVETKGDQPPLAWLSDSLMRTRIA